MVITSLSSSLLSLCFLFFELFRVPRSFEFEPVPDYRDYHDAHEDQEVCFKYFDFADDGNNQDFQDGKKTEQRVMNHH